MLLISHNVSVWFNSVTLNYKMLWECPQSAGYNVLPTRLDDNSEKKLHSAMFWNHLQGIGEAWDLEGITEKLLERQIIQQSTLKLFTCESLGSHFWSSVDPSVTGYLVILRINNPLMPSDQNKSTLVTICYFRLLPCYKGSPQQVLKCLSKKTPLRSDVGTLRALA